MITLFFLCFTLLRKISKTLSVFEELYNLASSNHTNGAPRKFCSPTLTGDLSLSCLTSTSQSIILAHILAFKQFSLCLGPSSSFHFLTFSYLTCGCNYKVHFLREMGREKITQARFSFPDIEPHNTACPFPSSITIILSPITL